MLILNDEEMKTLITDIANQTAAAILSQINEKQKDENYAMTTLEVAEYLHTTRNNVDILRNEGALPGVRTGNGWIFQKKRVDEFLDKYAGAEMSNKRKIETVLRRTAASNQKGRN